jgi:hypothetical protein
MGELVEGLVEWMTGDDNESGNHEKFYDFKNKRTHNAAPSPL